MTGSHTPSIDDDATGPTGLGAIVESMRLPHWIKNAFVVAPILFSQQFHRLDAWGQCLGAVLAFCLLSSGVYLINDVCDRAADRAHPIKHRRPVASGRLSARAATFAGAVLAILGMGIAVAVTLLSRPTEYLHGMGLLAWTGGYLATNLLYSLWLKKHLIVDVIFVALGFVLRAMAGAAAIAVPISPWLVVCTFMLCLYIALTKRRAEISEPPPDASNREYDRQDLEHMLTVSAALAILTYSLYCLAPSTVNRIGSSHMIWTIPLVVYGMFRYYGLTRRGGAGDPVVFLWRDQVMWLVLVAYTILTVLVLTCGRGHAVRPILRMKGL